MREQWNNKLGFLLAAIGSAVGLAQYLEHFPMLPELMGAERF